MAMTPRARSAGPNAASLLSAPRSLNELVTCMFSYLTRTEAPVSAESFGAGNIGVRTTWPAMARRAASMSANVTLTTRLLRPVVIRRADSRAHHVARATVPLAQGQSTRHLTADSRISQGNMAMIDSGQGRIGVSFDVKPHAYDPAAHP